MMGIKTSMIAFPSMNIPINNKKILAIIPARAGSKGLARKNIKSLCGKPLIAWTIEEAKKSNYIDKIIVSSDDEEISRKT
jgi:N-acylneuraminate cytidylyltransferase